MRGNYSSRTGTFFCIWLHSRNVIHYSGYKWKKFFIKTQWKRQNFEDQQVSKPETSSSGYILRDLSSHTLFFKENFNKLCWRNLTYFNIRMDQNLRNDVEDFDTQTHGSTYASAHRRRKYFSDWTKKERDTPCSVWNCNVHFFNQWKIICSKLFKLKTDGELTYHRHPCLTTASRWLG